VTVYPQIYTGTLGSHVAAPSAECIGADPGFLKGGGANKLVRWKEIGCMGDVKDDVPQKVKRNVTSLYKF